MQLKIVPGTLRVTRGHYQLRRSAHVTCLLMEVLLGGMSGGVACVQLACTWANAVMRD